MTIKDCFEFMATCGVLFLVCVLLDISSTWVVG